MLISSNQNSSGHGIRLLVISPGVPQESRGGSSVLFYHYIAGLKTAGFHITHLLLLQPDNYTEQALKEYIEKMAEFGRFEVVPLRASRPITSGWLFPRLDATFAAEVRERAKTFPSDMVVCFDLLSARIAEPVAMGSKLVWLGDLNFQTDWHYALYWAKERPLGVFYLPWGWLRSLLWKRIYRNVLRKADSVIVSARFSQECLSRLGISSNYQPYPWPNPVHNGAGSEMKRYSLPSFLLFGMLTGLGSRSLFHFILKRVYPRVLRLWGRNGFRIFICGTQTLLPWVEAAIADKPEFKYLGFVEDIDSLMAACHAVLVPIDVPVGNRSRIVTAMAKGALVIAHRNTSLGNPDLVDGVTCYLASRPDQFVERMKNAFDHPEHAQSIIANARHCYQAKFAPEVASDALVKELLSILNQKEWVLQHEQAVAGR